MEIVTPPLKRFMAKYERYEPVVGDSTSRMALKTCPRYYFLKIVLGFRPKQNATYLAFGAAYHLFREVLEKTKSLEQALEASGKYWEKNGGDLPVGSDYDFLTGKRLFASCLKAHEWWQKEKQNGRIEVVATEQEFMVTLPNGKTKIGGRCDELLRWNGKLWGRDFKTTTKNQAWYQRLLEPNDQFTRYTVGEGLLCGETLNGQLVELMYNTKKEGPKVIPLVTSRTPDQLSEWVEDQYVVEDILDIYRNKDRWPQFEKNCPYCEFHSVCKQASEGAMMAQLESNFHQQPWDFTKSNSEVL